MLRRHNTHDVAGAEVISIVDSVVVDLVDVLVVVLVVSVILDCSDCGHDPSCDRDGVSSQIQMDGGGGGLWFGHGALFRVRLSSMLLLASQRTVLFLVVVVVVVVVVS